MPRITDSSEDGYPQLEMSLISALLVYGRNIAIYDSAASGTLSTACDAVSGVFKDILLIEACAYVGRYHAALGQW